MTFIAENWVALTSLVVAIVGGVPGVLAVVQHLGRRPRLRARLEGVTTGTITQDARDTGMILLTVTLSNEGEGALTPAIFELQVKDGGRWWRLRPMLIPEAVRFNSAIQDIKLEDGTAKDLQRVTASIGQGLPLRGHLLFISPELTAEQLRAARALRLVCRTVNSRAYRVDIEPQVQVTSDAVVYPKHGLEVRGIQPGKQ